MPQKILGLDLGAYSVKGALFDVTFRTYELTDLFESTPLHLEEVEEAERPVVISEAILRLLSEHSIAPSTVITALPGLGISTRVLSLPLSSKQVAKVLPFELESYLPFPLDEIVVDHHVIDSDKVSTFCLAAAARKTSVAEHLAQLKGANLDPAFVTLDTLALYNLHEMAFLQEAGAYAIVDIGHEKTGICIVSDSGARYVRSLFNGGRAITEAIREKLDLTSEQASDVKHSHGIVELPGQALRSQDLQHLSTAIRGCIDPLIQEVLQTLHAYRAQYATLSRETTPVKRIFLTGGSSLIRNLPEHMTSITKIPTERARIFPEGHPASVKLGHREPVFAQAVGLGLRAAARGAAAKRVGSINFRQNDFAYAHDMSDIRQKAFFFGRWAAVIFVLALLQVGFRYQNLSRQHRRMENQVLQAFREIAPNSRETPKTAAEALRLLQARIQEYRQKQEVLTAGLGDLTALGILREISERIPAEVAIDTQELSIERNQITLRALAGSFADVDTIVSAFQAFPHVQSVTKGDIREGPDGKKSFQLVLTIGEPVEKATAARRKR